MAWWLAAAGAQAAGALIKAGSASSQNSSQLAVNRHNAMMQYNTTMHNSKANLAIAGINAGAMASAAKMNMQLAKFNAGLVDMQTQYNNELIRKSNIYNATTLTATIGYNNSLLDQEMADIWEAADLDIELLENQRAKERGQIIAIQSGSGTVIGTGSNADVVIDQQTQEALDAFVMRHDAQRKVESVRNEQAKNTWLGQMEMNKMIWEGGIQINKNIFEGSIQKSGIMANAAVQSANQLAQAGATLASAKIQARADQYSARQGLASGLWNAQQGYNQNQTQIRGNMLAGLFGAASTGVAGYFQSKPTQTTNWAAKFGQSSVPKATTLATSNQYSIRPTTRTFAGGYEANFSLATSGGSLFGN